MGVRMNQRLPRALPGILAVALMAVAATTTLSAQTTMTPRLVVRALTNGDIATYKLPSTTQISGGLETVGLGEPLYLEVQIDIGIPASQIAGVLWSVTIKPAGSAAALAASPLGSNVPIAEPSDRLAYQVAGRQLLRPDVHGVYVVTAVVTAGSSGTTTLAQTFIAGTYVGIAACSKCHSGGLAQVMTPSWSQTEHASLFTNGINGVEGTGYGSGCIACHTVGYDANSTVNDGGFSATAAQLGWSFPTVLQPGNFAAMPATLQNLSNIQCENCHGAGSEHANYGGAIDGYFRAHQHRRLQPVPRRSAPPHQERGLGQFRARRDHHRSGRQRHLRRLPHRHRLHRPDEWRRPSPTRPTTPIDCYTCHEPHGLTAPTQRFAPDPQYGIGHPGRWHQSHDRRRGHSVHAVPPEPDERRDRGQHRRKRPLRSPRRPAGRHADGHQRLHLRPADSHLRAPIRGHQHLHRLPHADRGLHRSGVHAMPATTPSAPPTLPPGKPAEDLVAACQTCHGPDITSFNFPLFDYNGDGKIDGVQTEVQSTARPAFHHAAAQ